MRDSHNSANEKPLYFDLPVYSNGLFVYNSPPNFSLSSAKEHSSLLCSGLVYGFSLPCLSWIAVLCCCQINAFFFLLVKQLPVLFLKLTKEVCRPLVVVESHWELGPRGRGKKRKENVLMYKKKWKFKHSMRYILGIGSPDWPQWTSCPLSLIFSLCYTPRSEISDPRRCASPSLLIFTTRKVIAGDHFYQIGKDEEGSIWFIKVWGVEFYKIDTKLCGQIL